MYHYFDRIICPDAEAPILEGQYNRGYVFTRIRKGGMDKVRSVRVALDTWSMTSENRRLMRKTEGLALTAVTLPLRDYSWKIAKLAKDFYRTRNATFSANRVKEILVGQNNFNTLLVYSHNESVVGYTACFETPRVLHYAYPFYVEDSSLGRDCGMGMMLRAIAYAKESHKQYVYLGSLSRSPDSYKLQFKNIEWFDGTQWQTDRDAAKALVRL